VAAPVSPLKQADRRIQLPGRSSPRLALEEVGRHQFQVLAANVTDAVMSIGGLIFDRAMDGWDVSVVVEADADRGVDDRPIRILGGKVAGAARGQDRPLMLPRPHMLAVATDVLVTSEAVRQRVLAAASDNATSVLFWGRHHPPGLNCRLVPVRHRPSAAAQVFKFHAVAASGASAMRQADEGFYSMA
jgi:hypothetical protein